MDGEGTLTYEEEKRKYVGGFKQGLKHGKGEYYFPNGSR
jgi:antitoxin component YwqK of YwqJK toxin-antitoxin module